MRGRQTIGTLGGVDRFRLPARCPHDFAIDPHVSEQRTAFHLWSYARIQPMECNRTCDFSLDLMPPRQQPPTSAPEQVDPHLRITTPKTDIFLPGAPARW